MCNLYCAEHAECIYEHEVRGEVLSERYDQDGLLMYRDDNGDWCKTDDAPRKTGLVLRGVMEFLWTMQYGLSLKETEDALEADSDMESSLKVLNEGVPSWYISCRGEVLSGGADGRKSEWHLERGEDGSRCVKCRESKEKRGSRLRYHSRKD